MPEFADILIWLGIIGVAIGVVAEIFPVALKKRTPPACLPVGFQAVPITGDHWIAVHTHLQMLCQKLIANFPLYSAAKIAPTIPAVILPIHCQLQKDPRRAYQRGKYLKGKPDHHASIFWLLTCDAYR